MRKIKKFLKIYKTTAVIVLNVIILFIIANIFLEIMIVKFKDVSRTPLTYGMETLKRVYPDLSEAEIKDMVLGSWDVEFEYEPFTQFTTVQSGKYVNIDENGFRIVENQCKYPINDNNYNIFVFGGSTGFGVGVADKDTIPSNMQSKLRKYHSKVCIFNFGRTMYFSSQERALLEVLILRNQVPDMAIFIDGINDFLFAGSDPAVTKLLNDVVSGKNKLGIVLSYLPITRVYTFFDPFRQKLQSKSEKELKETIQRYLTNKRIIDAIGKEYNIKTYFVIQPTPTNKYNLSNHIIFQENPDIFDIHVDSFLGYNVLEKHYHNLKGGDKRNIIWLADMQIDKNENLYVDAVHYNANFSEEIAGEIVNIIKYDVINK